MLKSHKLIPNSKQPSWSEYYNLTHRGPLYLSSNCWSLPFVILATTLYDFGFRHLLPPTSHHVAWEQNTCLLHEVLAIDSFYGQQFTKARSMTSYQSKQTHLLVKSQVRNPLDSALLGLILNVRIYLLWLTWFCEHVSRIFSSFWCASPYVFPGIDLCAGLSPSTIHIFSPFAHSHVCLMRAALMGDLD